MFGFWYITIGFAIVGITFLLLGVVPGVKDNKFYDKLEYTYRWKSFDGHQSKYTIHFCDDPSDKEHLSETDYLAYKKIFDKYNKNKKLYYNSDTFIPIGVICLVVVITFFAVSIFAPIEAQQEANYWLEFSVMAEDIIGNGNEYQTIGIADKIIEYNSWLAEVRASKATLGCFSRYYNVDLSNLNYIRIGG
jgi:hypothetical protein